MSSLKSDLLINPQDIFNVSSSAQADATNLGGMATTGDGRYFRFATAGAVALVPGKLQQASAEITANQNLTAVAASIGDLTISASTTVTITANQYTGGWALITTSAGVGYQYGISGHAAFTAAAPTLTLSDPIQVALTTGSRIDLVANPYAGVVVNPTTATSTPVGVAVAATPIGYYGWVQTRGVANVLADGTVTVGTAVVASNATAGAVEALTGVQAPVGIAVTGIATTEYGAINLLLD